MRFLSLALLSGCALLDAKGDPHGDVFGGPGGGVTFDTVEVFPFATGAAVPANLDGNDQPDLLLLENSNLVYSINNNGEFMPTTQIEGGYNKIAAADLDGDGLDDPIGAAQNVLDAFRTVGGTPPSFVRHQIAMQGVTLPGSPPDLIVMGAFGIGAGRSLAITYEGLNQIIVVHSTFQNPSTSVTLATDQQPFALLAANIARDTDEDELVWADNQLSEIDSTLMTTKKHGYARPAHMVTGDFYGQFLAVAYDDKDSSGPVTLLNGGAGGFPDQSFDPLQLGSLIQPDALAAGDFDGDGMEDLAVLDRNGGRTIRLFLQRAGAQEPHEERVLEVDGQPQRMSTADFNGDGVTDFLLTPGGRGGVDLLLSN